MPKKGYTPEQIINKLREAEILLNQGDTIAIVSKKIGVNEYTYYRWRSLSFSRYLLHTSAGIHMSTWDELTLYSYGLATMIYLIDSKCKAIIVKDGLLTNTKLKCYRYADTLHHSTYI